MPRKQKSLPLETPFNETEMPFGKYKGKIIKEVDPSYLLCLLRDKEFIVKLKEYVGSPEFSAHIREHIK